MILDNTLNLRLLHFINYFGNLHMTYYKGVEIKTKLSQKFWKNSSFQLKTLKDNLIIKCKKPKIWGWDFRWWKSVGDSRARTMTKLSPSPQLLTDRSSLIATNCWTCLTSINTGLSEVKPKVSHAIILHNTRYFIDLICLEWRDTHYLQTSW